MPLGVQESQGGAPGAPENQNLVRWLLLQLREQDPDSAGLAGGGWYQRAGGGTDSQGVQPGQVPERRPPHELDRVVIEVSAGETPKPFIRPPGWTEAGVCSPLSVETSTQGGPLQFRLPAPSSPNMRQEQGLTSSAAEGSPGRPSRGWP